MSTDKKRVFIIDGYGQIYRSYFAFMTNPLKDKDGNNVSAVYGFFNTVMSLLRQYEPQYLVVAMDSRGKTFRHEMYDQYKANRDKTPEDLHAQIPVIDSFLDAMHIPHFNRVGMEADDIIATIARKAESQGLETVMVTGDKDLLQLVREGVYALRPPRKGEKEYRLCGCDAVQEIFGVRPDQIVDYLTILGDSSDNVPGIDGIGEKGAVKLLTQFGTLQSAYENMGTLTKSVAAKLEAARDHIQLSHDLVVLKDNVLGDDEVDFSSFETSHIDWKEGVRLFRTMGSESLAKAAQRMVPASDFALEAEGPAEPEKAPEPEVESSVVNVSSIEELSKVLCSVADNALVSLDFDDDFAHLSFSSDIRTVFHVEEVNDAMLSVLSQELARCRIVGQDLKAKAKVLALHGLDNLKLHADTNIMAWLLNTELSRFEHEDCAKVLAHFAEYGKKLSEKGLLGLFYDMEMPLLSILAGMEKEGIFLDVKRLKDFENDLEKGIVEVQESIFTLCGKQFNLNSTKQLQEVLFVDRNLPTGKKTKSGFSTDSDVLEELANNTDDPVPALLLKYRALSKLQSTYVQALPELVDPETGRIHTTFLQTGTATGRLSSKNPNLQNIPIRTDEGRRIRDAFVPKDGCTLMSADYSQIELVVLAHMTGDANLKSAFLSGSDVHRETAALIFGVFPEMVTPEQRRTAKTINFGIMYGMSAFRLSNDLKIGRKDAQRFIDTYFEQYSGVRDFIERTKVQAREDGFVKTEMGHIRYIPEMKNSNKSVLAGAERAAVNTVIQGTAAEIMKKAMIALSKAIADSGLKSKMLLQVHDEVIFEVPLDEVETMKDLVKSVMESAYPLSIPLRASIETGSSWGEMH